MSLTKIHLRLRKNSENIIAGKYIIVGLSKDMDMYAYLFFKTSLRLNL